MTYIERTGNLFDSTADAYAHGVNTEGLMGAGIAVEFKHRYPHMYKMYKLACKNGYLTAGHTWVWDENVAIAKPVCAVTPQQMKAYEDHLKTPVPRYIYNLASQDLTGPNARLEWFEGGLKEALAHAEGHGLKTIAMPRIGCGIGGLGWDDVKDITEHFAERGSVDIEVWSL